MICPKCEGSNTFLTKADRHPVTNDRYIICDGYALVTGCPLCNGTGEVPQPAAEPWEPIEDVPKEDQLEIVVYNEKTKRKLLLRYVEYHLLFVSDTSAAIFNVVRLKECYTHFTRINLPEGKADERHTN